MKKFLLIVAIAAMAVLMDSPLASAGHRGGRGGRGGCGGCGGGYVGCGYGGGCGYGHGGCGMSGCGMGGYVGGCSTCGIGGGYIGGCSTCGIGSVGACAGGLCSLGGAGTVVAQANTSAATLVVTLPENAQLTINGEETTSTSSQRVFVSPTLESGKEYEYTLKALILHDGKVQTATAKVTVRPNEVSRVELKVPAAGVAAQ